MSTDRITRVNELIRREIGEALFRLVNESGFDLSSVTVTHVITSPDLRRARVLISIRDHEAERQAMLSALRRHRKEMQSTINRNLALKYTPRLSFELDESLAEGDRMLGILAEIEKEWDSEITDEAGQSDFHSGS